MRLIDADALLERMADMDSFSIGAWDMKMTALGEIMKAPTVTGWVSVEDRLPEDARDVLIWIGGMSPKIGSYDKRHGWYESVMGDSVTVTHWMPLPEPPEEVNKNG